MLLAVLAGVAVADIHSFDCPMKQLGLNFVQTIQPFRSQANFQVLCGAGVGDACRPQLDDTPLVMEWVGGQGLWLAGRE